MLWQHRKAFLRSAIVSIVLAVAMSLCIPREYASDIMIADEHHEMDLLIGLDNMTAWLKQGAASQLGDEGMAHPDVYSLFLDAPDFAEEIGRVNLVGYDTSYFDYLRQHHRYPWWTSLGEKLYSLTATPDEHGRVVSLIMDNVRCKVNSRHYTVILQVRDQDPVVAALMTDSVCAHLLKRIRDYRSTKAKVELENARAARYEAQQDYRQAQQAYESYVDTHFDSQSPSVKKMQQELNHVYENAFSIYNKACLQYSRAEAFVQKNTPPFTVVKNATVSKHAVSPVTFGYVLAFLFIAFVFTTWWVLFKHRIKVDVLLSEGVKKVEKLKS